MLAQKKKGGDRVPESWIGYLFPCTLINASPVAGL